MIRLQYLGMKSVLCLLLLSWNMSGAVARESQDTPMFDVKAAERFANLALACVHKEIPIT